MSPEALVRLDPIETAVDEPIGAERSSAPLPDIEPGVTALTALEHLPLAALLRPPCVIPFSGGRDSSTLLAVATRVARREGLPLPIPATGRFPGHPETEESRWQEAVLGELGLDDWHRRDLTEELDLLGPAALGVLRKHGLMSPSLSFFWVPFLSDASPGSLVTGHDGDGLFGSWRLARLMSLARRQARFERSDLRGAIREVAPTPLRRLWWALRARCNVAWVRPAICEELARRYACAEADEPLTWSRRVAWLGRNRLRVVLRQALEALGAGARTRAVHAFLDPTLLAAVAREGGLTGLGDRNQTMSALFGNAFPAAVASRRDKIEFSGVYWGPRAREFAARWTGTGLPEKLIDPEALRREWLSPSPDLRSALLLHAAWLAEEGIPESASFNCRLS
jgi:Asparagine synthase